MRSIAHPGQSGTQRLFAIPSGVRPITTELIAGQTLLDAIAQMGEDFDVKSGAFRLNGGVLTSFSYVMPALSKSPEHAVYFSETFYVEGQVKLESASVTFGLRDGQPWLHCHAVWIEPNGRRHGGHLLPDRVVVATPIQLTGVALENAAFTVCPDPETNFSLFTPLATAEHSTSPNPGAYAIRLAPNVDLCDALEAFCQVQNIKRATIFGGVGSTVGAQFQDGRIVEPFVTELLIRSGRIVRTDTGQSRAEIDISIVDYKGGLTEGRLASGANPILVTAELVICPERD